MPWTIKIKWLEVHISVLPLVVFALLFDFAQSLLLIYAAVLLHEAAHALAAWFFRVKLEKVEVMPFGVSIKIRGAYIKSPLHEILIAASGPACSALLALLAHQRGWGSFVVASNLSIALVNLVPAIPLDGGRVLRAFLTEQWGYVRAFNFTIRLTRIMAGVTIALGAALLIYTRFNFSLLLIGAFLIVNAIYEQRGSTHIMMDEILRSREKLSSGCGERAGIIVLSENDPARRALKLLTYNRYYLVHVIRADMSIAATLTETRLIEQLVEKGIRIRAGALTG